LISITSVAVSSLGGFFMLLYPNNAKQATVKYLHAGESKSVKLTPAERPTDHLKLFAGPHGEFEFKLPEGGDAEAWKKWADKFSKDAYSAELRKMRFVHPAVVLGEGEHIELVLGDLPKDLRVIITKEGDGPAKIKVRRGDDEWEVTDKELDKLPEDVRPHVKKFLGPPRAYGIRLAEPKVVPLEGDGRKAIRVPVPAPVPAPAAPRAPFRVEARAIQLDHGPIEKQLGEINQRLEKIEKALEKLAGEQE
jgi:hypothetical protein